MSFRHFGHFKTSTILSLLASETTLSLPYLCTRSGDRARASRLFQQGAQNIGGDAVLQNRGYQPPHLRRAILTKELNLPAYRGFPKICTRVVFLEVRFCGGFNKFQGENHREINFNIPTSHLFIQLPLPPVLQQFSQQRSFLVHVLYLAPRHLHIKESKSQGDTHNGDRYWSTQNERDSGERHDKILLWQHTCAVQG